MRFASFRVPKRRGEWLLGRIGAKLAVQAALSEAVPGDWPLRAIEIRSEPGGRPCAVVAEEAAPIARFAPGAPLPAAVSISHVEGHALCAASWNGSGGRLQAIGIDLGVVEPRSPELVATFFTADERRFVRGGGGSQRDLRANLVWCAKEAVLKVLGLGLTIDTYAVTCLPDPGARDGEQAPVVRGVGWSAFVAVCAPEIAGGATIRGRWRTLPGGFVGALAWLGAADARVAPALAGAPHAHGRERERDRGLEASRQGF